MKKIFALVLLSLFFIACNKTTLTKSDVPVSAGEVLSLAKTDKASNYDLALSKGAEIIPIDDGKSFFVWYAPSDFDPKTDTVLVALHGHESWATRGFLNWLPTITKRHYAFLAIQYWFGENNEISDYYDPETIYAFIDEALALQGVTPGHSILNGFSRGATYTFSIAALDKWEGPGYFGVNIADSGAYQANFKPNDIINDYGDSAFENSHWILFCGEKDTDKPTTCDDMRTTNTWLTSLGGVVDLFLADPQGKHGSMMLNTNNLDQVMDLADEIVKKNRAI